MTKTNLKDQPTLFLVKDEPAEPSHLMDAQHPASVDARTPRITNISDRKKKPQLPDAQKAPDAGAGVQPARPDESLMLSRLKHTRPHLRTDRTLTQLVKDECRTETPELDISRVTEDAWRLWLVARTLEKLDAQPSNGISSSGSFEDRSFALLEYVKKVLQTTTTTRNTLGVQAPKSPPLPGFAAKVLELMPEILERSAPSGRQCQSEHSYHLNWAYAIANSVACGGTIKSPAAFVEGDKGNIFTAKHDNRISLWLASGEREERENIKRLEADSKRRELDVERTRKLLSGNSLKQFNEAFPPKDK